MSNKERLDILLVNRGLFESREKAKAAIIINRYQVQAGFGVARNPSRDYAEDTKQGL